MKIVVHPLLICSLGIDFTVPEVGSRNDAVLRTVMKGWLLSGAARTCSEIKLWVKVVIDCK